VPGSASTLRVRVNDAAEIVLDGEVFHLHAGTVYLVNQGCVHTAWNRGASERIHLVWDALLTATVVEFLCDAAELCPTLFRAGAPAGPMARRTERMPPYRRASAHVSEAEARELSLCLRQLRAAAWRCPVASEVQGLELVDFRKGTALRIRSDPDVEA